MQVAGAMRLVLGIPLLVAACVADVAGTHQSGQQNGQGSGSSMTETTRPPPRSAT